MCFMDHSRPHPLTHKTHSDFGRRGHGQGQQSFKQSRFFLLVVNIKAELLLSHHFSKCLLIGGNNILLPWN